MTEGQSLPVLVDATSLPPDRGGVARYIEGLLGGLEQIGYSVSVIAKPGDIARLREAAPRHRYLAGPSWIVRRPLRLVWEQIGLPLLAARLRATTIHSPHYTFALLSAGRSVVTLHDATFFSTPEAHGAIKRLFFRAWIMLSRRFARSTVVPSAATGDELDAAVGTSRHPVIVAQHGVDPAVFRLPSADELSSFALDHTTDDAGWIAFLGTIEPRKRVPQLIRAHQALSARRTVPALLIAGADGWDETALEILKSPPPGIHRLGYLPLDALRAFLGGAVVVVYPSVAEGFGLPVLEAMACGATVLTTPHAALVEVGGDAVQYADADACALERGLELLLDDAPRRAALSTAAVARAAGFTWEASARQHARAFGVTA